MFKNKVVYVTGGTQGIGKAVVERFLRGGAKVAFTDITDSGYQQVEEYKKNGHESLYVKCDATDEKQVKDSIQTTVAEFGRIDIAINNVGGHTNSDMISTPFHESTLEGWRSTQSMTLDSAYLGMKYQIAQMLRQGGGIIANTLSMSAIRPMTTMATPSYTAAKGGFVQLTRYLANSYATQNIRINGVAPGLVATDNLKSVLTMEQREHLAGQLHPNKKEVDPWEIAEAFAYLCSDGARSVTGVVIPVDGGMSAG